MTQLFLRDAWAWFAATPEEREPFRQEVVASGGGPDRQASRSEWRWWHLLGLAIVTAACAAPIRADPGFIVATMFALALPVVACRDRVREALRSRAR